MSFSSHRVFACTIPTAVAVLKISMIFPNGAKKAALSHLKSPFVSQVYSSEHVVGCGTFAWGFFNQSTVVFCRGYFPLYPESKQVPALPPLSYAIFSDNALFFTNEQHSLMVVNMPPKSGARLESGRRGKFEPRRTRTPTKHPPNPAPLSGQDKEAGGSNRHGIKQQKHFNKRCRPTFKRDSNFFAIFIRFRIFIF